jgi:hypothetical protein
MEERQIVKRKKHFAKNYKQRLRTPSLSRRPKRTNEKYVFAEKAAKREFRPRQTKKAHTN